LFTTIKNDFGARQRCLRSERYAYKQAG
jgi:hypothetical protein